MPKISHTAQIISDMYYQNYITDEDFLREEHFRYLIASFYTNLLIEDYKTSKVENQAETGYIYPSFSQESVVKREFPLQEHGIYKYAEVEEVVMFPFDSRGYGIQSVECVDAKKPCSEFIRETPSIKNKISVLPFTENIWWWVEGKRAYFYSANNIPDAVVMNIIPAIQQNDEDFLIPQSYELKIINGVLILLQQAAQGKVVDMTNDSNPNAVMANEIDNALRNLKVKA